MWSSWGSWYTTLLGFSLSQSQWLQVVSAATSTAYGQKDLQSLMPLHKLRRNLSSGPYGTTAPPGSCRWAAHWNQAVTWGFKFPLYILVCSWGQKSLFKSSWVQTAELGPQKPDLLQEQVLSTGLIFLSIHQVGPWKYDQDRIRNGRREKEISEERKYDLAVAAGISSYLVTAEISSAQKKKVWTLQESHEMLRRCWPQTLSFFAKLSF